MDPITCIGLLAGVLTTTSFFPQLMKIRRTRSARDISWSMFGIFCAGVVLWLVYGVLHRDLAIIASNSVTLVLVAAILILKAQYGRA